MLTEGSLDLLLWAAAGGNGSDAQCLKLAGISGKELCDLKKEHKKRFNWFRSLRAMGQAISYEDVAARCRARALEQLLAVESPADLAVILRVFDKLPKDMGQSESAKAPDEDDGFEDVSEMDLDSAMEEAKRLLAELGEKR